MTSVRDTALVGALLGLGLVACNDSFERQSQIERVRVLGVREVALWRTCDCV